MIAGQIDASKLTFELEHDAEILAHDTGIHVDVLQEMMKDMIEFGLFEQSKGVVTCYSLAKRLDTTNSRHPELQKIKTKLLGKKVNKEPAKWL